MWEYEVQGYYYGTWECLTTEDSLTDARDMKKCYDENEPNVLHRIKTVRAERS